MQKIVGLLYIFLFLQVGSFGQGFPLIYGVEDYFLPNETIEISPGEFVSLCGVSYDSGNGLDFGTSLLKFNSQGVVQDLITITTDSITTNAMELCSDGNLLLLCTKRVSSMPDTLYPVVFKVTDMGEVLWRKDYPYFIDFIPNDLAAKDDDSFIFSATNFDPMFWDNDVLIYCDAAGDTIWTEHFIEGENEFTERVINGSENSTLVVGEARSTFDPDWSGFIRKVDETGTEVWRYLHSLPDISLRYHDVTLVDDDYLLVGLADNNSYLRKISESNQIIDEAYLGGDTTLRLRSITRLNDQFALTGSGEGLGDPGFDAAFVLLDEGLEVQVVELFGGEASDSGTTCITTTDGRILISGRTRSFNPDENREGYFLLLDSSGQVITSLVETGSIIDSEIKIYPNPLEQGCTLKIESSNALSSWQIYDIKGQKLRSGSISSYQNSSSHIPNQNLPEGYYILHLLTEYGEWVHYPVVIK